jgi:serine/threonine protein kinase
MVVDHPGPQVVAGRYTVTGELGRGGMGVVWRAHDELLDRDVALKEVTFPVHLTHDERALLRERTLREARAAARLDNPHVTRVFDVVEDGGSPWVVMEHVPSRSLQQLVDEQGALDPDAVARIGLDVLSALEDAHRAGIVHRDVKPGNILVGDGGRAWLTDFGIATATGDDSLTAEGVVLGSPAYMSPERAQGEEQRSPVDLWSLGATLYTAVEGRLAFSRGEPLATLLAVVSEEPAPPIAAGPLAPVLRSLLIKDPQQRATATQAREQLQAVLAGEVPVPATTPPAPVALPSPGSAATAGRVVRFDREQLRALATASRTVLGGVVRDARDQARDVRHLAVDQAREVGTQARDQARDVRHLARDQARDVVRRRSSDDRTPTRPRFRFKRRWVVVPAAVGILLALALLAGAVTLVVLALGQL